MMTVSSHRQRPGDPLESAARGVVDGDATALRTLYDLLAPDLYRLALIACDRPDDAERAVTDTFAACLLGLPTGRHPAAATPEPASTAGSAVWTGPAWLTALQSCCIALGSLRRYSTDQIARLLDTQDQAVKHAMTEGLRTLTRQPMAFGP